MKIKLFAVLAALSLSVGAAVQASAAPPATTRVASGISIEYTSTAFVGNVSSTVRGCVRHRTVRVFKQRSGSADVLVGADLTGREGHYRVPATGVHGNFYAKVQRKVIARASGDIICRGATSTTIHVAP
jgi:hypothetical protein